MSATHIGITSALPKTFSLKSYLTLSVPARFIISSKLYFISDIFLQNYKKKYIFAAQLGLYEKNVYFIDYDTVSLFERFCSIGHLRCYKR